MKAFIGIVVALALILGFTAPAFANECPALIKKVEEKMESAELSDDQRDQVSGLLAEGESLCDAGQDDKAVEVLNKALEIMGE